jgi:hypothetical protein
MPRKKSGEKIPLIVASKTIKTHRNKTNQVGEGIHNETYKTIERN